MIDQEKFKSIQDLIESFNTDGYEEEIKNLEKRIQNIEMGRPEFDGIYKYASSSEKRLTENEKEKRIENLKMQIKHEKQEISELSSAIYDLKKGVDKIESLAQQKELLYVLVNAIKSSLLEYERREKVEEKMSVVGDFLKKPHKLYYKSDKTIKETRDKIGKEIYKILKKNAYKKIKINNHNSYSIDTIFKNFSRYSINPNLYLNLFSEFEIEAHKNLSYLGVDVDRLEKAKSAMRQDGFSDYQMNYYAKTSLENLEYLKSFKKDYYIKGKSGVLSELEKRYELIAVLGKEIWFVEEIIDCFSNAQITNTEIYKNLSTFVQEQQKELRELVQKADKLYEESGTKEIIEVEKRLQELYRELGPLYTSIEECRKTQQFYRLQDLTKKSEDLRYEMVKLLEKYPDLDKDEYGINIKKRLEAEKETFEPKKEEIHEPSPVKEPSYIKNGDEEMFIERTVPVQEKKDTTIKDIELTSTERIQRTYHYQNYMREKVLKSDLGNLSFSEYLEAVAPNLKELIDIEKQREAYARTIYKEYLKYYSYLEDKKSAIPFEEFAEQNYGISNIDVPIENEEEYKGMMRK